MDLNPCVVAYSLVTLDEIIHFSVFFHLEKKHKILNFLLAIFCYDEVINRAYYV